MQSESPKRPWADRLPAGEPERVVLGRIVDEDNGNDEVENRLFDYSNDPQRVELETKQRRFRGQLNRRLRRRGAALGLRTWDHPPT